VHNEVGDMCVEYTVRYSLFIARMTKSIYQTLESCQVRSASFLILSTASIFYNSGYTIHSYIVDGLPV
jgi:hypothetical protein